MDLIIKICCKANSNRYSYFRKVVAFILFMNLSPTIAQYSIKEINPYHKVYHDSLKAREYPYTFPLLAKQAYKKGFDIPFTYGLSSVFYAQRQDITIKSTRIGLNGPPEADLSGFIKFGNVENKTQAFTIRPDMWILPFLNVYGVIGTGSSKTEVPLIRPVDFTTIQDFGVNSLGFGVTLAGGLGPVVLIVDNNINFADVDVLVEPVPAYNLDIRVGHNFVNERRADRGITVWFGAFYQKISGDTNGSIPIKDLFPDGTAGLEDQFITRLEDWAGGLPPGQQIVANQLVSAIEDYLSGLDAGDQEISYLLDKELAKPWNLIFGAQYQHNKHWQLRTELGTFGRRTSFLLMLNYRFESLRKTRALEN